MDNLYFTQCVFDYYSEELENYDELVNFQNKTKKEIVDSLNDICDFDKEFNDLYDWIKDNDGIEQAKLFYKKFETGVEEELNNSEIELLRKYSFHIFAQAHLAIGVELK